MRNNVLLSDYMFQKVVNFVLTRMMFMLCGGNI